MVHAPEIDRPGFEWLNSDIPLSLAALKGRVVVLDFWTYCCVNCLHAIPVLHELEGRFGSRLVVIGVHSPKFSHERNLEQVKEAVKRYDIRHPVIHDRDRRLWEEYTIRAWPTLVLISADGYVIGHYPGEPQAAALEAEIARSLDGVSPIDDTVSPAANLRTDETDAGHFLYPAKIKRVPGAPSTWVMSDTGHHQIVLLDDSGAEIDRFGSGECGFVDGAKETARLNGPEGLCGAEGTVFVADTRNHAVRRVDLASGHISTIAGTGERGSPLPPYWTSGDHLSLASPWDLELVGDRLFIANAGTHQIVELRLDDGNVRLAAGSGREGIHDGPALQAQLAQPSGLAYHPGSELLYFVDSETSSVRRLDLKQQWIETLVGHGLFVFGDSGGTFSEARLQHPLGITVCGDLIYVADSYNNTVKIIDPVRQVVSVLDRGQYTCNDPLCVPLGEPAGLTCACDRRLLVVDTNNHRVVQYDLEVRTSVTWSPPQSELTTINSGDATCA